MAEKAPEKVAALRLLLDLLELEFVEAPTPEQIDAAAQYVVIKDAHVIAAAQKAGTIYLVTYDRKHLLNPTQVAEKSGLRIVEPKTLLIALDAANSDDQNDTDTESTEE